MFKYRSPGTDSFIDVQQEGDDNPDDPDFGAKYEYTEGQLDGPYDFAYSRVESYMGTSSGMKAQMLTKSAGKTKYS